MNAHAFAPSYTPTALALAAERKARLQRLNNPPPPKAKQAASLRAVKPFEPIPSRSEVANEDRAFWWSLVRMRDSERWQEPETVKRRIMGDKGQPRIDLIMRLISKETGVSVHDMVSQRRTRTVVLPRQVAMHVAKITTRHSLPVIGQKFGGRDHTTIIHAVRKIQGLLDKGDERATFLVNACTAELRARGYQMPEGC